MIGLLRDGVVAVAYGVRECLGRLHSAWIEGFGHDDTDDVESGARRLTEREAEAHRAFWDDPDDVCICGEAVKWHFDAKERTDRLGPYKAEVYGPRAMYGPLNVSGAGCSQPHVPVPGAGTPPLSRAGLPYSQQMIPDVLLARIEALEASTVALRELIDDLKSHK